MTDDTSINEKTHIEEVAIDGISKRDFDGFILSRLKAGDENAFEHIFTRWEKPLFRFVKNLTGSEQDAEDICQETFATLWLTRASIDPDKNIKSYIFLIARQKTWKHLRAHKRKENFLSNAELGTDDNLSPENIVQLKEMELLTEYAISKLPERTREIYKLHYMEDLSYEQISELLKTNPVNIKTQIYQARKRIREVIAIVAIIMLP